MIFLKYVSGCFGNFLCSVLISLKRDDHPLEFNHKDILHIGRPHHLTDDEWKQMVINPTQKNYKIVSCDNTLKDSDLDYFYENNFKTIFVELSDRFVEYRLNHYRKVSLEEHWVKERQVIIDQHWGGFKHPHACDEARRIFRLYQGIEQTNIRLDPRDIIFRFADLYQTKEDWKDSFHTLGKQLNQPISDIDYWYDVFQITQKPIIQRAKELRKAMSIKKFGINFSEEEKGIVIGEYCYSKKLDDNRAFDEIYDEFS